MVTLIFIFFPKLYIILIHPEKNIRALFTTSKSIRCHIGSRVASAISYKTSSSFSSCPGQADSEFERDSIRQTKPINRSSSCQTSIELLYALLELQDQQHHLDVANGSSTLPAIGWSELNLKELSKLPVKFDQLYECNQQLTPVFDQVMRRRQTSQVKSRIYDNSMVKFKTFLPTHRKNQKQQLTHSGQISKEVAQTEESSYIVNSMPSNLDVKSAEPIKSNKHHEFTNGNLIEPIFTIESPVTNPNLIKTTISEESLSECSLSESCDCKLKSITIRIASPNLKI